MNEETSNEVSYPRSARVGQYRPVPVIYVRKIKNGFLVRTESQDRLSNIPEEFAEDLNGVLRIMGEMFSAFESDIEDDVDMRG